MTKESAQALIELLMITIYLDEHVSVPENNVLERALASLGWTMQHGGPVDVGAAYRVARAAAASAEETERFVKDRTAVIKEAGQSSVAHEWLGRLLGSDGVTKVENEFINRLTKMMFD